MRLWLVLMIGLLCFAMTSCPVEEEVQTNTIEDAENRQPDFTEEEAVAEPAEVCETCGMDPCECEGAPVEDEAAADEEAVGEEAVDEEAGGEEEPAAVCETCGKDPCECEDEHAGHDHGEGEHEDG